MMDSEIFDFVIDNATVETVVALLLPNANVIRLYNHIPEPATVWWDASVPITRGGPNRNVKVQSLAFDVEMSKSTFLDAAKALDMPGGGLTLVQSYEPLRGNIHPQNFKKKETLWKVLAQFGACLFFDLPHSGEAAGLTIFGCEHMDVLIDRGVVEIDKNDKLSP